MGGSQNKHLLLHDVLLVTIIRRRVVRRVVAAACGTIYVVERVFPLGILFLDIVHERRLSPGPFI